jgi:ribosomal protein S18 acetylase RimI-like enzyme
LTGSARWAGADGADFRAATADDLPMITEGERAYMREIEPASLANWERAVERNVALWLANLDRAFVLENDGSPVGYLIWMRTAEVATLITINVAPEQRRHGYGAVLLAKFVADATARGAGELRLGVHRDNPAERLYQRAGFDHVGDDGDYRLYSRRA